VGRLEYLVQKATEMGVNRITPVFTDHTQLHKVNPDGLSQHSRSSRAMRQSRCPGACRKHRSLKRLLSDWDPARRIIFCNESQAGNNPAKILSALRNAIWRLLVGPEGGFSEREREILTALPFVTSIPLGPRILRADTAAVAALTAVQMTIGDW
jgi:16S rRNA (uracil1498-N3)-methyltransferase